MRTDKITLGDGKEYIVTEYDVGDFIALEEKYGSLQIDSTKIGPVIYWFWLAVRKHHKDMKLEDLYKLLPASFIFTKGGTEKIMNVLSSVNGWDEQLKNVPSPVEKK